MSTERKREAERKRKMRASQYALIVNVGHFRPKKSKKYLKIKQGVAIGVNLAIVVMTALCVVSTCFNAYGVLMSRTGTYGGEVIVFPTMFLLFFVGYSFGKEHERDRWEGCNER